MSYKVTITDNKNGKVIVNEKNVVAIVGAFANKRKVAEIGLTDCGTLHLANLILSAETIISEIKNQVPTVDALLQLKAKDDKTKANNNEVEE